MNDLECVSALTEAYNIAASIHQYIDLKENKNMAVLTPQATVETVEVEKKVKTKEKQFLLRLTPAQAGYLIDLLHAHVAGDVAHHVLAPLGYALTIAGAVRLKARNTANAYGASRHAVLDFTDAAAREAAGAPPKASYLSY